MKNWMCTTAIAVSAMALSGSAFAQGEPMECSDTFTVVDANSDGIVSTKEASDASAKEFDRIDMDKSGAVSKSEWQGCGDMAAMETQSKQPLSDEQEFTAADRDKSGDVTREEAAMAAEKSYGAAGDGDQAKDQMARAHEDAARNYGARFTMIDADGDGSLSKEEWDNRDNVNVVTAFERLDADGNDELSKSEYQEARNTAAGSGGDEPVTIWYYYIY